MFKLFGRAEAPALANEEKSSAPEKPKKINLERLLDKKIRECSDDELERALYWMWKVAPDKAMAECAKRGHNPLSQLIQSQFHWSHPELAKKIQQKILKALEENKIADEWDAKMVEISASGLDDVEQLEVLRNADKKSNSDLAYSTKYARFLMECNSRLGIGTRDDDYETVIGIKGNHGQQVEWLDLYWRGGLRITDEENEKRLKNSTPLIKRATKVHETSSKREFAKWLEENREAIEKATPAEISELLILKHSDIAYPKYEAFKDEDKRTKQEKVQDAAIEFLGEMENGFENVRAEDARMNELVLGFSKFFRGRNRGKKMGKFDIDLRKDNLKIKPLNSFFLEKMEKERDALKKELEKDLIESLKARYGDGVEVKFDYSNGDVNVDVREKIASNASRPRNETEKKDYAQILDLIEKGIDVCTSVMKEGKSPEVTARYSVLLQMEKAKALIKNGQKDRAKILLTILGQLPNNGRPKEYNEIQLDLAEALAEVGEKKRAETLLDLRFENINNKKKEAIEMENPDQVRLDANADIKAERLLEVAEKMIGVNKQKALDFFRCVAKYIRELPPQMSFRNEANYGLFVKALCKADWTGAEKMMKQYFIEDKYGEIAAKIFDEHPAEARELLNKAYMQRDWGTLRGSANLAWHISRLAVNCAKMDEAKSNKLVEEIESVIANASFGHVDWEELVTRGALENLLKTDRQSAKKMILFAMDKIIQNRNDMQLPLHLCLANSLLNAIDSKEAHSLLNQVVNREVNIENYACMSAVDPQRVAKEIKSIPLNKEQEEPVWSNFFGQLIKTIKLKEQASAQPEADRFLKNDLTRFENAQLELLKLLSSGINKGDWPEARKKEFEKRLKDLQKPRTLLGSERFAKFYSEYVKGDRNRARLGVIAKEQIPEFMHNFDLAMRNIIPLPENKQIERSSRNLMPEFAEPKPEDYLREQKESTLAGGDPNSENQSVMEMSHGLNRFCVKEYYGQVNLENGRFSSFDISRFKKEPDGEMVVVTGKINKMPDSRPIVIPLPENSIAMKAVGYDKDGKEFELKIINAWTTPRIADIPDGVKAVKIRYGIMENALRADEKATAKELGKYYEKAFRKYERTNGELKIASSRMNGTRNDTTDEDERDILSKKLFDLSLELKSDIKEMREKLNPVEVAKALEIRCRNIFHYDHDYGARKDDLPQTISGRMNALREVGQENGKEYAGVCSDASLLLTQMLREAGILAGPANGMYAAGKNIGTKEAHASVWALLPNEKGRLDVFILDGTPNGLPAQAGAPSFNEKQNGASDMRLEEKERAELRRQAQEDFQGYLEGKLEVVNGHVEQLLNIEFITGKNNGLSKLPLFLDIIRFSGIGRQGRAYLENEGVQFLKSGFDNLKVDEEKEIDKSIVQKVLTDYQETVKFIEDTLKLSNKQAKELIAKMAKNIDSKNFTVEAQAVVGLMGKYL